MLNLIGYGRAGMTQVRKFAVAVVFALTWRFSCGDSSIATSSSLRVTLPQGYVTGVSLYTDSSTRVNAYLGLPYALPPIGDLRFAPPERHPGWNRTLFAGHFRPDCLQLHSPYSEPEPDTTNEDCLYLNVFVPEGALLYRNYPVVVFLHGIDYVVGSPLIINAEELAKEGVIVVTLSYRLNVFGFLSFEDEYARGNLGLLDQYMALLWVRDNIEYFGGSSSNITLMGHGSGASSVLVHMTSPRTQDLFQRAILMSGSLLSPWLRSHPRSGSSHPVLSTSRAIARSLGCYGESYVGQKSASVLACLRQKGSDEILKAFQSAYQNGNWSNALGPISDNFLLPGNQYLPMDPTEAILLGKYHKMPLMTGTTVNEGTVTLHNWRDLINQNEESVEHFIQTTAIGNVLDKYHLTEPEMRSLVTWKYLKRVSKNKKPQLQLLQLYNEAMYLAPFWRQTEILSRHSQGAPMFVYVFTHPSPDYLGNYGQLLNLTASAHGSDLVFLFGPSLFEKVTGRRFTVSEERLNSKMKRLFAYFIRLGNASPPSYGYNLWSPYNTREQNYLKLYVDPETGRNLEKLTGNPHKDASSFWNWLLPSVDDISVKRMKKMEELLGLAGASNVSRGSGGCKRSWSGTPPVLPHIHQGFLPLRCLQLIQKRHVYHAGFFNSPSCYARSESSVPQTTNERERSMHFMTIKIRDPSAVL
ncbi:hypothetical protein RUM44_002600 [Polyplax serrata]|uniref:Carboxylesterase type B domain-containing protein n=1 Tax=Polyplax serrata TaxID=468196 RepID=A0ABR1AF76_POLSC